MTSNDDWEEGEIRDNDDYSPSSDHIRSNNQLTENEEMKDEEDGWECEDYQSDSTEYRWNLDEELVECSSNDDGELSDQIDRDGEIIPAGELCCMNDEKSVTSGNATGNHAKFIKEIQVDDSWIFHSLGDKTEANPQNQNTAEQKRVLPEQSFSEMKHISEMERKFAEEKENYVRNMYSLLVTAREQIVDLQKKNKKLKAKLQGNYTLKCPECKYQLSIRGNSLQPKYTKILKGRCAIEMSFVNMAVMEEWLVANNLDINPDGLPVLFKSSQQPTLASTNSLLAAKQNKVLGARETLGKNIKVNANPTNSDVLNYFESKHTVVTEWNVKPTGTANDLVNQNAKKYGKPGAVDVLCCPIEKRNHWKYRKGKEQRHNKKRPGTDIYEDQSCGNNMSRRSKSPGEGLPSSAYDQQRLPLSSFQASCWGADSCEADCNYTLQEMGRSRGRLKCRKHFADRHERVKHRRSTKKNHHRSDGSRSKMDSEQQRSPSSWHSKRKEKSVVSGSKGRSVR